jgi:hypothetical protein
MTAMTGGLRARVGQQQAFRVGTLPWQVRIYLLCLIVPLGFNIGSLAMTSLRVFLLLMIVPVTIRLLMGKYGRLHVTDVFYFLHIGWAGIALAVNNPDQVLQQFGSVGMEFIGGYVIGRAYIRSPEQFTALCRWLVISVLVLAPFAVLESLTGRPILIETIRRIPGLTSVVPMPSEKRLGLDRAQVVFAHPIHFGLYCAVIMSLAFVGLKNALSDWLRWFASGLVGAVGFLALSSGAFLAILLQLGLFVWSRIFAPIRWRWWLLVGCFAFVYVVIDILSNRSPIRVFMSYATFSAHTAYWRSMIFEWGLVNVWKHPIFGLGLNDWERPYYMYSPSMDNFWLVMAVRYGIPGFITVLVGYVWTLVVVMARDFRADPVLTQFRRAWVFTFLGLSFTLCTVHIWSNVYSFCFFIFGAGMWLVDAVPKGAAQTNDPVMPTLHRKAPAAVQAQLPMRKPRAALPEAIPEDEAPSAVPTRQPVRHSRFAPRPGRRIDAPPRPRPPTGPK